MNYTAYRRSTNAAAGAIRDAGIPAEVTSLAGGFFGILLPREDHHVIVCRDLDGAGEWLSWPESPDGERLTDDAVTIGHVRPRDYATLGTV